LKDEKKMDFFFSLFCFFFFFFFFLYGCDLEAKPCNYLFVSIMLGTTGRVRAFIVHDMRAIGNEKKKEMSA
jgi:hypothetical protein